MSKNPSPPVGVIGGGLGGLAAACTLAARGHSVVLLERSAYLGGKAAVLETDGYRFDMGPTILTLPSVLHRIFAEAGKQLGDYLDLVRVDPQWRSFFTDGSTLDLFADSDRMAATLDGFATGSGAGYRGFLERSERLHRVSDRFFFWRPVGGLRDMVNVRGALQASTLRDLLAMSPGRSVAATVRSHVADGRVAQMLDHFTQYVGSAPDQSPAVLCGIAHMQTSEGVWYPRGGTGAIPRALERLACELGVDIRTETGVRRILLAGDGSVRGVETDSGETIPLSALVSNADTVRTHRELLGGTAGMRFERRRRYEPACSGVVLYLGLDRRYEQLLHHNFVFSRDPEEEFEAIYRRGEPAVDPTCYVCAPARTEPAVAPPGGEALYVLVHAPYLRPTHDWERLYPAYRKTILAKLASTAGLEDIADRIRVERWLTPADIHRRYGVLNGAIYGIASHGRWLGAFKPSNRSPDVKGLYLGGGAAHPGPGMPMVLMSGWIAADALDRDGVTGRAAGTRTAIAVASATKGQPSVAADAVPAVMTQRSPWLIRLFSRHVKRSMFPRSFHAVRLARSGRPDVLPSGPLIVVLNHPSWWDPLVCLVLSELFPDREHYAPMDAAGLQRYRFFGRLGMFGVEAGTLRGARTFLQTARAILARPNTALWITTQGRFVDPRDRYASVQPGVAHLARHLNGAVVLPLALEYPFWSERFPEALARFGEPVTIARGREQTAEAWRVRIEEALTQTQDALAQEAQRRDPAAFDILLGGKAGPGGVYDWWRAWRARWRGERFRPEHAPETAVPAPEGSP